jgi:hypothetical protein
MSTPNALITANMVLSVGFSFSPKAVHVTIPFLWPSSVMPLARATTPIALAMYAVSPVSSASVTNAAKILTSGKTLPITHLFSSP